MKRNAISCVSCIATVSNNTYSLHSATILTHTISYARRYSAQKEKIVIPKMTSEANSTHSPLFLGREHGNMQNYKVMQIKQADQTRLLRFVPFVYLPLIFRSFLCRFTLVYEGHFVLYYKEKTIAVKSY